MKRIGVRLARATVLAGIALQLGACQGYDAGAPAAAGGDVQLAIGERRAVAGVQVGFHSVLEDSRCPRGVQCITAGRAIVRAWVLPRGGDTTWVEPVLEGGADVADTSKAGAVDAAGFTVQLRALDPYPVAGTTATRDSIRATLRIQPGS